MLKRLGLVALLAVALVGCKKKPKDEGKASGETTKAAMTMEAMAGMEAMTPAMRAEARRPAMRTTSLVAAKLDKPSGMVVLPKGKNPLAGVDIGKGFGEGWFGKGGEPAMTPEAMAPTVMTPEAMAPNAAPMTPAAMTPATPAARPATPAKPKPLPLAQYIHPDKSFGFRYPEGWKPVAKVGKQNGVPVILVQAKKDPTDTAKGELGAIAIILPKNGPSTQQSCQAMIKLVKKGTPSLKTGPLKPLKGTQLLMFKATHTENNQSLFSLGLCGTVHGRIMFLSYFSLGKQYGSYASGYQLGQALFIFTSDLLKK